jgi:hypothetical protein
LKRLIIILVFAIGMFSTIPAAGTQRVTEVKVLSKVVMSKINIVLLKPIRTPYWYVPSNIMAMWAKVNICEMGGRWSVKGPTYSGGLGITNINWKYFGGFQFASNAALATPMQQVVVAERIQGNNYVPDQYGCGPGW